MTIPGLLPPATHSNAALRLAVAAVEGDFCLPVCRRCGLMSYPPGEICSGCLGDDLDWQGVDSSGEIVAATVIERPIEAYFRAYRPLPVGLIRLASGAMLFAFLAPNVAPRGNIMVALRLNAAGSAVLVAGAADASAPLPGLSVRRGTACLLASPDPTSAADRLASAFAHHGIAHQMRADANTWVIAAQICGQPRSVTISPEVTAS